MASRELAPRRWRWVVRIAVWTFLIAVVLTDLSGLILQRAAIPFSLFILLTIIMTGVFFDIIAVAATAGSEKPFHAMAAKKQPGAKQALRVIRNADKVANFTADVVGDIAGIVSGAAGAAIALQFATGGLESRESFLGVFLAGLTAALTIGGKAVGKGIGISRSTEILLLVGRFLYFMERRLGLKLLDERGRGPRR
ncbi:MAG: hypothetical protein HYY09_01030 [Firmicutes bacterium]|nr:hypothetical protein [Bacillota bacterium]